MKCEGEIKGRWRNIDGMQKQMAILKGEAEAPLQKMKDEDMDESRHYSPRVSKMGKERMCKRFMEEGRCPLKGKCPDAHNPIELKAQYDAPLTEEDVKAKNLETVIKQ